MSIERAQAQPEVRSWQLDSATVCLIAVSMLALAAFTQPQFDPDFWWHLRIGLDILAKGVPQHNDYTFTAATHSFISQEWGSGVIYALLYRAFGMSAVILLMAGVTWIGFALGILRVSRPGVSRWIVSLGAALLLVSGLEIWGPSPQMFTFGLLGVLLVSLDAYRRRPRRWLLLLLVPLFVLWGNLHGGFLVGLGVLFLFALGEALSGWVGQRALGRRQLLELFATFGVCCLAPMVNPNGLGLYLYPLRLLGSPLAQANLNEWQPTNFHSLASVPVLLLLLVTLLAARWARHTRLADILLALGGTVLMLYAVRDIPLFALLVLPLFTDGLAGLWQEVGHRVRRRKRAGGAPIWFSAAVLVVVAVLSVARIGAILQNPLDQLQGSAYPVQVGRVICDGPQARVFDPYGEAGWLLYRLAPRDPAARGCVDDRVFIFGEVDLMGPKVLSQYLKATKALPGTMAILRHYRVTLVWQGRGQPLDRLLAHETGWTCVFADSKNILYASPGQARHWHASRSACPSS